MHGAGGEIMVFFSIGKRKSLYYYDPMIGIYVPDGDMVIEKHMAVNYPQMSIKDIQEVVEKTKNENLVSEMPQEHPEHVCLNNGVISLKNFQLLPFRPDMYFFRHMPVNYSPEIPYDDFLLFVSQLVSPKDAMILQEFIGYCLLPDTRYQKALFLQGSGANGKSTFINIISNFFGKEHVSAVSLQQLESNKFMTANLHGKYINVFSDLPAFAMRDTSVTKSVITGDAIEVQRKFKSPFTFNPTVKIIVAANEFPEIPNPNIAFFRRWVIIQFKNIFIQNPVIDIEKRFFVEDAKSAILNWALDGLKRLQARGKFDIDERDMRELWTASITSWYKSDKRK
jgi:putative DNA primase/helicase